MSTSQMQLPIELVVYPMIFPIVMLVLLMLSEWFCCIIRRDKDNKNPFVKFNFWLNLFRGIFYFMAVSLIYKGLRTGQVDYPLYFAKYTLVPAEYVATIPLFILEGLAGLHSLAKELIMFLVSPVQINTNIRHL